MSSTEKIWHPLRALIPCFLLWFICLIVYDHLIQSQSTMLSAEHFVYIVQVLADAAMISASFLAFYRQQNPLSRFFFGLIFLSITVGMVSTEIYNLFVNIFQIKLTGNWVNEFWILAYTGFLVVQIIAWIYLFLKRETDLLGRESNANKKNQWFLRLPILQSAILIFISICLTGIFNHSIFSKMELSQLSNSILETVLFILISLCLSRLKNKSLCYLATGFLFLITFNLAHRLTYMLHIQARLFDMAWLLSYIVIIFGFYASSKNQKAIRFFEEDSIHVIVGALFLAFTGFLFLVFTALEMFFAFLQNRFLHEMFSAYNDTAGVLVFTFMLSVLAGKIVASYWSAPVEEIMRRIHRAQKLSQGENLPSSQFLAWEVQALDAFIMKSIGDLQIANRVKDNFLMNMSHDFRTPASGMYNFSKRVYKNLNDEGLKHQQGILVESARQFLNLLEDILDFSRFSSQKEILAISEISVKELIDGIVALMKPKAEEKNLFIEAVVDPNLNFYTDSSILLRILINLVSNALKFTEKGYVVIGAEKQLNQLKITIEDSGIGIDPRDHARIFEPFTQIEKSQNTGIGLGLSNVKSMLATLGGSITLKSELGRGSIFEITLHEKNP